MTGFIIWTAVCAAAAVALLTAPLLRSASHHSRREHWVAAFVAVLIVAAAALLYQRWSNWPWRNPPGQGDNESIATLLSATQEHADDAQSWIALGRAYLRIGQLPMARRSFEQADHASHGQSAAALSGLAQVLVFENNGAQTPEAAALFERALALDPHSPQALFYTGVALLNSGRLPEARARFAAMRALGPPPQIIDALDKQIAAIDVAIANSKPDPATAIHLQVTLDAKLHGQMPAGATLFVFVRSPQGGPPLAVKRLPAEFPQRVDLSAADSIMVGRRVGAGEHVQVVARVSASGTPIGSHGDLFGELKAIAGTAAVRTLTIDQRNP
jgi:cytochrome c-type biogenesis protein CcmH